jgi:2-polyprenyl-3-methyl-5-hydroxy-6-metoxy-1,4-benzoquinol methylase
LFHVEHSKMELLSHCPVCNSDTFSDFLICKDYFLTQEEFTIVECTSCGFKFVNPRPDLDSVGKYYESPEYISHDSSKGGLLTAIYTKIRKFTHKKKYRLVNKYSDPGNILDIGCASGELLNLFKVNNWKSYGIEPNEKARNFAKETFGLDVKSEDELKKFPTGIFDVIMMWHVLEHVYPLNDRILDLKRLLKPGGTIFIAVPNCNSYDAKYYGKFWAAYDVPRHFSNFVSSTMKILLEKNGFTIVKILPMKFDSFYVSLLSEKYKYKKLKYFHGFSTGLKSNLKARKSENTYSSLIYIVKNTIS